MAIISPSVFPIIIIFSGKRLKLYSINQNRSKYKTAKKATKSASVVSAELFSERMFVFFVPRRRRDLKKPGKVLSRQVLPSYVVFSAPPSDGNGNLNGLDAFWCLLCKYWRCLQLQMLMFRPKKGILKSTHLSWSSQNQAWVMQGFGSWQLKLLYFSAKNKLWL